MLDTPQLNQTTNLLPKPKDVWKIKAENVLEHLHGKPQWYTLLLLPVPLLPKCGQSRQD